MPENRPKSVLEGTRCLVKIFEGSMAFFRIFRGWIRVIPKGVCNFFLPFFDHCMYHARSRTGAVVLFRK